MQDRFTSHGLKGGVWEGTLSADVPPARVALTLDGRTIARAGIEADGPGTWRIRATLPAHSLSGGVQTYILIADDGEDMEDPRAHARRLGHLPLLAGEALDLDLRAEIGLLRAEVDLLKRELRRLAAGQAPGGCQ